MALVQDCFLFNPDELAATWVPHMENIQKNLLVYAALRSSAISLYDSDPQVRELAANYGGWDRASILSDLPAQQPSCPEDIAFWFVILLYKHLWQPEGRRLGLGSYWRVMDAITTALGWNTVDRELLIGGHSFKELVQTWLYQGSIPSGSSATHVKCLDHLHPSSTGGSMGWMDHHEAETLLVKLNRDRSGITPVYLPPTDIQANTELVASVYQSATDMLTAAMEEHRSLCLITSG